MLRQRYHRLMKFHQDTIRDPEIVDLEGATVLLPEGWKREGGFVWMPQFSIQANLLIRVSDPNTGAAMQTLLAQHFVWSWQPSVTSMPPGSNWLGSVMLPPPREPAECVHMVFMPGPLQHLRGARLVRVEDLQPYAAELALGAPQMNLHATRLRYAFDWNGQGWEEDVYLIVVLSPPEEGWLAIWRCAAWSARAPMDELDGMTPLLAAIALSVRTTFDWAALLAYTQLEFQLNIKRQQTRPIIRQQRGAIWAQEQTPYTMWVQRQEEIRKKHRPAWEARQPGLDRERIVLSRLIGGLETYINPFDSGRVQLPSSDSGYWISKEGQVVTASDAAFDPSAGSTPGWKKMMLDVGAATHSQH